MQIRMSQKVNEGSGGFLGDLGKIIGAAAPVVSFFNPAVGAGMAAISGVNSLSQSQGSVDQKQDIQTQGQGGAMGRRLMEGAPMQMTQAQQPETSPEFEALKRRLILG